MVVVGGVPRGAAVGLLTAWQEWCCLLMRMNVQAIQTCGVDQGTRGELQDCISKCMAGMTVNVFM